MKKVKERHHFILPLADLINKIYPNIEIDLREAKIDKTPKEYITAILYNAIALLLLGSIIAFFFLYRIEQLGKLPYIIIGILFLVGFFSGQRLIYPKYLSIKRIKRIEVNLVSALRDIQIQIDSGLSLYQAIVHISEGGYGEITRIFREAVKKMETGVSQADALRAMVSDNPSFYFRRVIWHISTALTAGGDISEVLKDIIHNLVDEQSNQIQLYGSKLRPLAMSYMLLVLIVPSLGTTFVIALLSFVSTSNSISYLIFGLTEVFVAFFQITFLGMIKVRRPNLLKEND
jgi:flagellar protein FlaJ